MLSIDEDAFLPTDTDRLKAQIKELKNRLAIATEKRKQLRRQLIEEDLSFVIVSKLTEGIKDPTRVKPEELEGLRRKIWDQLVASATDSCVQEIVSYYRLNGITVFDYKKKYSGVRIETFYNGMYKEPYHILFLKSKPGKIDSHSIPPFIPVDVLAQKFLPENIKDFLRIVDGCLQAYVSRREKMNRIIEISDPNSIVVLFKNEARTRIELQVNPTHMQPIHVTISFENRTSSFPTNVVIKDFRDMRTYPEFEGLERDFMDRDIVQVLLELTAPSEEVASQIGGGDENDEMQENDQLGENNENGENTQGQQNENDENAESDGVMDMEIDEAL